MTLQFLYGEEGANVWPVGIAGLNGTANQTSAGDRWDHRPQPPTALSSYPGFDFTHI